MPLSLLAEAASHNNPAGHYHSTVNLAIARHATHQQQQQHHSQAQRNKVYESTRTHHVNSSNCKPNNLSFRLRFWRRVHGFGYGIGCMV